MRQKLLLSAGCALLAAVGLALGGARASAQSAPSRSDCRGEASYTSTSLGIAFDVNFDFALRDEGGEDQGWVTVQTSATPGVGFQPGFTAAANIHSVEFHGSEVAIFVVVWQRGSSGALGAALGLAPETNGIASIIGLRSGATPAVSEAFFWAPAMVPTDPNSLLDDEALDDFGQPFEGFEGATVREFILAQFAGNAPNRPPFLIHPGGTIQMSGGQ